MIKLLFATHNKNKLKEISSSLDHRFNLLSLSDVNFQDEIPEDFQTLQENAEQKARTVQKATKLDCFADDTGLEVDALQGRPGVYSARYAGEPSSSERNMAKLLDELKTSTQRSAQFRTVICLLFKGSKYFFEGKVEGEILLHQTGKDGFGYDPIFKPQGYSKSFAEMSLVEKNKISHRARAFKKMLDFLKNC